MNQQEEKYFGLTGSTSLYENGWMLEIFLSSINSSYYQKYSVFVFCIFDKVADPWNVKLKFDQRCISDLFPGIQIYLKVFIIYHILKKGYFHPQRFVYLSLHKNRYKNFIFNNYSPRVMWILLNNPRDEVDNFSESFSHFKQFF